MFLKTYLVAVPRFFPYIPATRVNESNEATLKTKILHWRREVHDLAISCFSILNF